MTPLDDASAHTSWRPILSTGTAERALQAVDAIAEAIPSDAASQDARDPSLGRGEAGRALLYAWLARTGREPQADVLARQYLDRAIEAASMQALSISLYAGFTGVAWAADLFDRVLDPEPEDR